MANYSGMQNFTNLAVALRAIWERELVQEAQVATLFDIADSSRAVERNRGLEAIGLVPKNPGAIPYDDYEEGDLATYTPNVYKKGIRIPRELIDDEEYGLINRQVRGLALAFNRTVAHDMASVFNNAFDSGTTGADGKPLCSTGGVRVAGKAALNNKGTAALTHANVIAAKEAMRKLKDARGNLLMVMPDTLVVPIELEAEADEIVNSTARSGTANNDINANRGMRYIADPLLTDTNNWFLVDSRLASLYLHWYWRVRPEFAQDPSGDYNTEMLMRGYARWAYGWDTHVWVYGNEVA